VLGQTAYILEMSRAKNGTDRDLKMEKSGWAYRLSNCSQEIRNLKQLYSFLIGL